MKFSKWHGLGNDFVIMDDLQMGIDAPQQLGKELCDRHFGIGADGLVIIRPSVVADYYMLIINSDGTIAEMCGNATRCFAKHLRKYGFVANDTMTIETPAGIKTATLMPDGLVRVDLGRPAYTHGSVSLAGDSSAGSLNRTVKIEGRTFVGDGISMGNPHFVIFTDDADVLDVSYWGSHIACHEIFPAKTNVEFVKIVGDNRLRMRVWERGCGITLACGTGSAATLAAAVLNNISGRVATIVLDGGELLLEWADDGRIFKTGAAEEVFTGNLIR